MSTFNLISVKYGMNASFDPWIENGQADAWFTNMAGSEQYFGWLSEYNSGKPVNGSYGGQFTITADTSQSNVTEDQILNTLIAAMDEGKVPKPDETTQYILHIPKGLMLSGFCSSFCAYHSSHLYNSVEFKFSMAPYSSDCQGCAQSFEWFGSTVSHEIAETITDPLGTTMSSSSYRDQCENEIGDICNDYFALAKGSDGNEYPVQRLWSNSRGECYAGSSSDPNAGVPTGMPSLAPVSTSMGAPSGVPSMAPVVASMGAPTGMPTSKPSVGLNNQAKRLRTKLLFSFCNF